MKKMLSILVVILSLTACMTMDQGYQDDADIIRIQHFDYYLNIINQYHSITGRYPYEGELDAPGYVFIMTDEQEKYFKDTNPYTHYSIDDKHFFQELRSVVDQNIIERYDPQKVPTRRPNFYMYLINDDKYYLAVHLNDGNLFAKKIGKNYFKLEASNNHSEENKTYSYEYLSNNEDYNKLVTQEPVNAGFFKSLEDKYRDNSTK